MRESRKPAIYIIDALNFVRGYFRTQEGYAKEDELLSDLIFWLDDLTLNKLAGSEFRLIIDGSFRDLGQRGAASVSVIFTPGITADELILEQAQYLFDTQQRVIVVSSDRELTDALRESGIKTNSCSKFFSDFNR